MPNSATPMRRNSSGSTSHRRSIPSLIRKPTPNNDNTTPTFTGTLPVVNHVHTFVNSFSMAVGSRSSSAALGVRGSALAALGRTTGRGGTTGAGSRGGAGGSVA